jgi:hypothetical protein
MNHKNTITLLVILIVAASAVAATTGILSEGGPGSYDYQSIRGQTVTIYGKGLYRHMSADVAVQGIAQDYVTLFIGIPLLILATCLARRGSLRGRFLLAGTLGYFLVTYLFYLIMAMYNAMFLVYVLLMGCSFFALALTMMSLDAGVLPAAFHPSAPVKLAGGFLLFNAASIGLLWLSVVVPPLADGTLYPKALEHYTTLVVQGMDLGLLLPLAAVTGVLLMRKRPYGYLLGPVYLVFLSILMAALTSKVIAMGMVGQNIVPAVFLIPTFALASIGCATLFLRKAGV